MEDKTFLVNRNFFFIELNNNSVNTWEALLFKYNLLLSGQRIWF